MLLSTDLSNLPPTFRSVAEDSIRDFLSTERGHVRANNDRSFEAQANFFANWCRTNDLDEDNLKRLNDEECVLLLGSFLSEVKAGDNMKQSVALKAQMLTNYLSVAHAFLQVVLARPVNIYDAQSLARQPRYHPFLGQQLAEHQKWAQPATKKEPFTADMFQWIHDTLLADSNPTEVFFGRRYACFNYGRFRCGPTKELY
jgi:hypothetical protein